MKQFQVPQFIDVEDKLFGPFTLKQFIYMAGGGGTVYVLFQALPTVPAAVLGLPIAGLALALAFWKPNGQAFIVIMQAAIKHIFTPKLYLWQKDYTQTKAAEQTIINQQPPAKQKSTQKDFRPGTLETLSWSLDVFDSEKETYE